MKPYHEEKQSSADRWNIIFAMTLIVILLEIFGRTAQAQVLIPNWNGTYEPSVQRIVRQPDGSKQCHYSDGVIITVSSWAGCPDRRGQ